MNSFPNGEKYQPQDGKLTLKKYVLYICLLCLSSCNKHFYADKAVSDITLHAMSIGSQTKIEQSIELFMMYEEDKYTVPEESIILQRLDSALAKAHIVRNKKFDESYVIMVMCITYSSHEQEIVAATREYVQTMSLSYAGEKPIYSIHHTYKINYDLLRFFHLALPPSKRGQYISKRYLQAVKEGDWRVQ